MIIREEENPDLHARILEQNLLRQYDLLNNCIEIGLLRGPEAFDKFVLWALNQAAVANIIHYGGRYREEPIYVGDHIPPHFNEVENLMSRFFGFVHENWAISDNPMILPAYVLWRLNWIHPFVEGNGRTARAACYYVICMKVGGLLPGRRIVPERIRDNREPYYEALQEADKYWNDGHFNVDALANYLGELVEAQIMDKD